ncbi:hypothetical protein FHS17_004273 [Paenibacillus lupini]|nr:hypothetical protein [Paenibacillus lupini]
MAVKMEQGITPAWFNEGALFDLAVKDKIH